MRRLVLLALLALLGISLVPLAVAGASSSPGSEPATVTATGFALIPPPPDPVSVYAVQVMGPIDASDPKLSVDAYRAKLERVRQAVLGAGVPSESVTPTTFSTQPTGAAAGVSFNSLFRYEVRPGALSVAAAQAAFAAGASMVYDNMPSAAIGIRRPSGPALDAAIADATTIARSYAVKVVAPRTVGDPRATTLTVKGQPDNAPIQWTIEVTVTFAVP
jgi:hypothetical protein